MIVPGWKWVTAASWGLCLLALPAQASELNDLVKNGDVAAVASALDKGADINEVDGVTALFIASEAGNFELAELLVNRGADVNLPVKFQRTPLYAASEGGFADIVRLLLDKGANPNQLVKSQTALHAAAENGCLECVTYLVNAGAEVNALTSNGSPPIHFAKRNGYDDIVVYLRAHGAGQPAIAPISAELASADVEAGKELFDGTCVSCHFAAPGAEGTRINLWGIVGRPKASEGGDVEYSPVLKDAGGSWTFEELNSFISGPALALPGTDMTFEGVHDEHQRADLIAYLRTLSDAPLPLPQN